MLAICTSSFNPCECHKERGTFQAGPGGYGLYISVFPFEWRFLPCTGRGVPLYCFRLIPLPFHPFLDFTCRGSASSSVAVGTRLGNARLDCLFLHTYLPFHSISAPCPLTGTTALTATKTQPQVRPNSAAPSRRRISIPTDQAHGPSRPTTATVMSSLTSRRSRMGLQPALVRQRALSHGRSSRVG